MTRLLNEKEAAEILHTTQGWLRKMRTVNHDSGPAFVRIGGNIRYTKEALQQFIEQNTQEQ